MRLSFLIFYLILLSNFTQAQISVIGTPSGIANEFQTSLTLPMYTVPAGNDRLLVVSVGFGNAQNPISVTFMGTSMNSVGFGNVWTLVLGSNMAGMTGDIVFTTDDISGNAFDKFLGINAISFSGVEQTIPVENYTTKDVLPGSTASNLIVTSRVGDFVYSGIVVGCTTPFAEGTCTAPPDAVPDAGQTIRNDLAFLGTVFNGRGATSTTDGTCFVDVGWNFSGSTISPLPGSHVALNIRKKPVAGEQCCIASGDFSTAMGFKTMASGYGTLAIGVNNTIDPSASATSYSVGNRALVIGNGTCATLSDAMTVLFDGTTTIAGDLTVNSDMRLKSNISSLGNTLASLQLLDGKKYTLKTNASRYKIGLLAQDVAQVFPELVLKAKGDKGTLSLNYQGLIPVLINAVNEQQDIISELKQRKESQQYQINAQQQQIDKLTAVMEELMKEK